MKTKSNQWKLLFLLFTPFFINGICNKDDNELPNADQYVTWTVNGQSGELTTPTDSLDFDRSGNTTSIYGQTKPLPTNNFYISFDGAQTTGTYSSTQCEIIINGNDYGQVSSPVSINVTGYGAAGGYITGTYSGTIVKSSNNTSYNVTGEFRIKNQ